MEDGDEVAVIDDLTPNHNLTLGTQQGMLHLWNVEDGDEVAVIDGQRDIAGGRGQLDRTTAANSAARSVVNPKSRSGV